MASDQQPNQTPPEVTAQEIKQEWSAGRYATLAIICLLIALGTGTWLLSEANIGGVQFDRAYYVILIVIGVSAAFFLFGVMRSTARIKGRHMGAAFDIGGPAVVFLIVVAGGFYLTEPAATFNTMIRLRYVGPPVNRDAYEQVLPRSKLRVSIGTLTIEHSFTPYGEVELKEIPGRFRDRSFNCDIVPGDIALVDHDLAQAIKFPSQDEVVWIKATLRESEERAAAREKLLEMLEKTREELQKTEATFDPAYQGFLKQPSGAKFEALKQAAETPLDQANDVLKEAGDFNAKFGGLTKETGEVAETLKNAQAKGSRISLGKRGIGDVTFEPETVTVLWADGWRQKYSNVGDFVEAYKSDLEDWRKDLFFAHQSVAEEFEPIISKLRPSS